MQERQKFIKKSSKKLKNMWVIITEYEAGRLRCFEVDDSITNVEEYIIEHKGYHENSMSFFTQQVLLIEVEGTELDKIEAEIYGAKSVVELQKIKVRLTKLLGDAFLKLNNESDQFNRSAYKSNIAVIKSLQEILAHTLAEKIRTEREENSENSNIGHKFRVCAKKILPKEQYNLLMGLAVKPLSEGRAEANAFLRNP